MNKKVLVVEDDKLARQSLVGALEELGIKVEEAGDGEEALKKAEVMLPDLVVADIHMPKMDGMEMIKQLHASKWGANIPVIIMTTDSTTTTLYDALKGGVSVYLSKTNLDVDSFAMQVKQALGLS